MIVGGLSPAAWAFFSTIVITTGGAYVQTIKSKNQATKAATKADDAATNAEAARRNTVATSNGFAASVHDDLKELRRLAILNSETSLQLREDLSDHVRHHRREDSKRD